MTTIHYDHTDVVYLASALQLSTPDERKALVLLARAQQPPKIVYDDDVDALSNLAHRPIQGFLRRCAKHLAGGDLEWFIGRIHIFFTPTLSGFVMNFLYALPITEDKIEATRLDAFLKELEMTQMERRHSTINWNPFFTRGFQNIPIHPSIAVNAHVANSVFTHMVEFRRSYRFRTIFPATSNRGVSTVTQGHFKRMREDSQTPIPPYRDITPTQLLQHYLRTEETVPGESEMRQKWYPTGLKPRTYFAQGGDAYFASLYLKTFFNSLADSFVFTNRFARVDPTRLKLMDPTGQFVIYDFTAFTSNFSEQYHFLKELAAFFEDCPVTLLGPHLGRSFTTIGSLINDYAEVCNNQPEFRFGPTCPFVCSEVAAHIQAGFLGVYGNLMTCTIPHGLVARTVSKSDATTSTAGDDGAIEPLSSPLESINALKLLGKLALEKCFFSSHPSVYLKLPFQTVQGQVVTKPRMEYPNLNYAQHGNMDPRFAHLQDITVGDKRLLVYTQIVRFIRRLHQIKSEPWELGVVTSILQGLVKRMMLRDGGGNHDRLVFHTRYLGRVTGSRIPRFDWRDLQNPDFTRFFPVSNPHECIRLRRRGVSDYVLGTDLVEGTVLRVPGGAVWKYLENCGNVVRSPVDLDDEEDSDFVYVRSMDIEEYKEMGPELYRLEVLEDVPSYTMDILYARPEARYIDAVEMIQGMDREQTRKRLRSTFSGSSYVDLDAPLGFEVVLDYDEPVQGGPTDMTGMIPYEHVISF